MTQQEFIAVVSNIRETASITRYQMAKHCSTSWQRLDEIEKGKRTAPLQFIITYIEQLQHTLSVHGIPVHTQQDVLNILLAEYKTQIAICRQFNLNKTTVNKWFKGISDMSLTTFLKLFPNPEII